MNSNGRRCNSNWHTALLNDLAEVNPKLPNILASSDVVSFVPMSAISAETAGVDREETRTYQEVGKGYTPFVSGDLLIAKITPCFENGKIIQAQLRHSVGFGSTEFHVIRPHKRKLNPRYGLHYLRQEWIRRAGERRMTGSAGQRRVPEAFFAGLRIPLPPLYEQRRIAKILDQAEALRAKRRATLIQLDSFTQSVFFDLFGDPLTNPNNMKVVRLADVATRITDGVHLKPNYTDGGVPFISVKDISTGRLIFDNCRFISPEDHQRFTKRCKPERHDILYTKIGTYGRPALIETDREFSIYVSVCLIKPRKDWSTLIFYQQL